MSTRKAKFLRSKDKFALANIAKHFEENEGKGGKGYIKRTMEATKKKINKKKYSGRARNHAVVIS